MKMFNFLFLLIAFMGAAQADIKLNPYCYTGSVTMRDGSKSKVFLQLNEKSGNYYKVEKFNLGTYAVPVSGRLAAPDTLQFNSNDDYIPGGNASYNVDIELSFNGKKASGVYKYFKYEDRRNPGRGGFGQADKDPNATQVEEGVIELSLCKLQVVLE